jgi:hypothetical protein
MEWILTAERMPPRNLVVETKVDDGKRISNVQDLKRIGTDPFGWNSLWFFPDGSMYVYYIPTHWRTKL